MVAVGTTEKVVPVVVPTNVPPHDPVYHFQLAPAPSVPPLTVRLTVVPGQTTEDEAVILVPGLEVSLTLIVTFAQPVVLHVPSALTA